MSEQLTDLRDYSRPELGVSRPAHFVYNEQGQAQDKELLALSVQLRIAEALEAHTRLLQAQLEILYGRHAAFGQKGGPADG